MKKTLLFATMIIALISKAQETPVKDTSWKVSGLLGLNFSITDLQNWSGGGENNLSFSGILKYRATYTKNDYIWDNDLSSQFGVIKTGTSDIYKKNLDQILFLTKYDKLAFDKVWYYTAQADYRTQFAPGYVYKGDSIVGQATSDFNSPGYVQLALGISYKPNTYFSLTFAPIAGKITFVNRQYLADAGAYGVEKAVVDTSGRIITPGKKVRTEFGGRIIMKFKKEIAKNLTLDSYLDLFTNYQENPGNIDVIFNNLLAYKLTKYFSVTFLSQMLYDDDIVTVVDKNNDGLFNGPGDVNGPRLQLMTTFAIGFNYKF